MRKMTLGAGMQIYGLGYARINSNSDVPAVQGGLYAEQGKDKMPASSTHALTLLTH